MRSKAVANLIFALALWASAFPVQAIQTNTFGRVLIAVYAVLALAATARSVYQLATKFDDAPVAYALSGLAGVVYILATIALLKRGDTWYRVAWITIIFEFVGVMSEADAR